MCRAKRWAVLICLLAMVVSACAPAATPTPVVIEKEKIVKETQVVLVTPTPVPPTPTPGLPDEIKIGVFEPLTGNIAGLGQMELMGIKLANKKRATVLGKPVRLVITDNKSDKSDAALAMSRLIEVDQVHAVIGSAGSSLAMAGGEVSEKAGMPVLGASCTSPLVTQGKAHYFRVCFVDTFQGAAGARYAFNNLGAKTAAIITDVSTDATFGLSVYFRAEFIKLTGNAKSILGVISIQGGDRDFRAQLSTINSWKPDVVYAPQMYAEAAPMLAQALQLGLTPGLQFLGVDGWDVPELIKIGGAGTEGAIYTTHYHPEAFTHPEAKEFLQSFRQEYNSEPSKNAALGYDAYLLLLDAIERAGSLNREAITTALSETKDFVGCAGSITLGADHNARKPVVVLRVKGGKTVVDGITEPF